MPEGACSCDVKLREIDRQTDSDDQMELKKNYMIGFVVCLNSAAVQLFTQAIATRWVSRTFFSYSHSPHLTSPYAKEEQANNSHSSHIIPIQVQCCNRNFEQIHGQTTVTCWRLLTQKTSTTAQSRPAGHSTHADLHSSRLIHQRSSTQRTTTTEITFAINDPRIVCVRL